MGGSNSNSYMDRLKSIRKRRQSQIRQEHRPHTSMSVRRTASLFIALSVLACMALTVFSTMARNATSSNWANSGPQMSGLIAPQSTAAAGAYGTDAGQPAALREAMGIAGENTKKAPTSGGAAAPAAQSWDRKIIRTATLQLKVKDVAASLDTVRTLAGAQGGYISSSDSRIEGEYTVATVTLQVPAAQFDDAMTALRKVGVKAVGENVSSADVTEEYTDLQSQLRNLQATEMRIQALMVKAERIEDVLTLDRELRQIQSEIERITGRTNYLSKRAEMSSITVTLYPEIAVVEPVPVKQEGWNPGKVASEAWNASLAMLSNVATIAITVAVFMWWAVPLLLLALWLMLRPRRQPNAPPPTTMPDAV